MIIVIVRLEAVVVDSNGKDVVSVSNFVAQTPVVSVALTTSKDIECSVREIVVKCGQLSCPLFAGVKGGRSHNVSKNRRFYCNLVPIQHKQKHNVYCDLLSWLTSFVFRYASL